MSTTKQVRAVRGATTVARDDAALIADATFELLREMIDRNGAAPEDLISLVFTATPDLAAEFPAVAARKLGLAEVPLLCAREIDVPGALPRCIRVLMYLYTDRGYGSLRHVYLGEAQSLRTDLRH